MKITNSAKEVILSVMKENGSDCLDINFSVSCCSGGKTLHMGYMYSKDAYRIVVINGINVSLRLEDEEEAEELVINAKNGELFLE